MARHTAGCNPEPLPAERQREHEKEGKFQKDAKSKKQKRREEKKKGLRREENYLTPKLWKPISSALKGTVACDASSFDIPHLESLTI